MVAENVGQAADVPPDGSRDPSYNTTKLLNYENKTRAD